MVRTALAGVLAGVVLVLGGLARAGEGAPAAGGKVALGRDLRAFPEGDYEVVQSFESRTQQQAKDQPPQSTSLRNTLTFDMKFKPPGEKLEDEGHVTVAVARVQVEMEVGDTLFYDSAARPDLKVEPRRELKAVPREGGETAGQSKKDSELTMQSGQVMARQFSYLVGRSSRAVVRLSVVPNRPQIEKFEGLDVAWDEFVRESHANPKDAGGKLDETSLVMLKRTYGDSMLTRMLAQGVEFLPPAPPRDPNAPLGTVRKATVAVGDTWKVTRRLLGARFQPTDVEHTCKLIAVKDGDAVVSVAWKFDHKAQEDAKEGKSLGVAAIDETGSMELTFHATSAMLTGLKSTVIRAEKAESTDETGKPIETTSKAVETRSFVIRPKI